MNSYNLLSQNWIPVLYRNGLFNRVGILNALQDAHRIRQIAATNPMDRVAILRFLLALLYWCKDPPAEHEATTGAPFPPEWFSKLEDNRQYFDLFGQNPRFYQHQDEQKESKSSANYLLHEIPTATNIIHFRHSRDGKNGLCPACCAMGLIRLPVFATSGGRGLQPGINDAPPLYVIPIPLGFSLAATIRLSWRSARKLGKTPAWKEPRAQLPGQGEVPLLTGLTWLPRRVWLDQPEEPEDYCISCGSREKLIRHTVFVTKKKEKGTERTWDDPHVIAKKSTKENLRARNPLAAPDADTAQWATILAALLEREETDNTANYAVTAFSSNKAKYLDVEEYIVPSDAGEAPEEQHAFTLAGLTPDTAQQLLAEIEWLRGVTLAATSSRAKQWRDRPNGHVVVEAVCGPQARGHGVRSALSG